MTVKLSKYTNFPSNKSWNNLPATIEEMVLQFRF